MWAFIHSVFFFFMLICRAGREQYGDSAIGYVQLKRDGGMCEVQGRITPEHKVSSKPYRVAVVVNEEKEVECVQCFDCVASKGGCKHGVALLMWLNRRSAEPAVTEVQPYWKKPRLSLVGSCIKAVPAGELRPSRREATSSGLGGTGRTERGGEEFFEEVVADVRKGDTTGSGLLFDYFAPRSDPCEDVSLDRLLDAYLPTAGPSVSATAFMDFCEGHMSPRACQDVAQRTRDQANCALWHSLRFGRVTASKVYDIAHCQTPGGSLVMSVIGVSKLRDTAAMKRGRDLEPKVLGVVAQKLQKKVMKAGLVLRPDMPIFGASPDGLTADGKAVIEVKCPSDEKALRRYITKSGTMAAKHRGQVQLLMHMTGRRKAYFCVAEPSYPEKGTVMICREKYDEAYCHGLVEAASRFWREHVFTELPLEPTGQSHPAPRAETSLETRVPRCDVVS